MQNRFRCLTGLRGISILWVVFVHLPIETFPFLDLGRHTWGIGIDSFLAISGFLVTRSLLETSQRAKRAGRTPLSGAIDFIGKRASRILPPYLAYCLLLAFIAVALDRSLYERLAAVPNLIAGLLLFFANFPIGSSVSETPAIVLSLWSLALQEQFYILLVLLFLFFRNRLDVALGIVALGSIAARFIAVLGPGSDWIQTAQIQMWTPFRLDAIAWSALAWIYYDRLSFLWRGRSRALASHSLIALSLAVVLVASMVWPGNLAQAVLYTLKAILLALAIRGMCELDSSPGTIARLLRLEGLGKIGVSAYEIYLLNPFIISATFRGLARVLPQAPTAFAASVAFVMSIAAGWLAYRIFGRPFQTLLRGVWVTESSRSPS